MWLPHVGFETYIILYPLRLRKSKPFLKAPVPEILCTPNVLKINDNLLKDFIFRRITHTKLFLTAGESAPRISLTAAFVKSAKPRTGKYS